jgi:hypothetical protein
MKVDDVRNLLLYMNMVQQILVYFENIIELGDLTVHC